MDKELFIVFYLGDFQVIILHFINRFG